MPQVVAVAAAWVAKTITVKAVTAFVVKTVLQVAATVALSKAAKALGLSKQSIQERQASVTQLSLGEVPREAVFGLACTGGSLLDAFNFGGKYGTDTVTRVIELADHFLDGIVGYYVDDVYCAWTGDGVQPGFNGKLSIEFKNGFASGNVPPLHVRQNGGWSASDVLAGVAHVVVDTRFDDTVWTQGHPRFKFVVRGLRVYDPRRDPALGYTGPNPQTWGDTSTHTFSRNAALLRYAYTRGIYATGHQGEAEHLLIGRGLSAEEAPPARIIAAANLCDEAVDGEIRYTADGVISANQAYIEVEELFAAAMAGVIVQREGGVEIEPGQAKAPVVTITDGDLVIGKPIGATPFLPDSDGGRINTIVPRYVEPTQGWLDHAAPVIRDLSRMAPAPVGDGGPREMTLALALVIRASQANGNGAIALRKAALERRATITLPPRFAGLEEGDWIAWKSDRRHGGATVRYRVVSFSLSAEWQNSLVLEEIASSVYGVPDPVEDRTLPPPVPAPIDALQLLGVEAESITLAGETSALPAIRFRWDVTTADTAMTAIRAEVREMGETDAAPTRIDDVSKGQANVTNGVTPDKFLQARLIPIGDPSRPVLPSNWLTVSTSPVIAGDLAPGSPIVRRIDEILLDVEGLIETFGSTEAAAVSAAAADTARALAEAAKQGAIDAKTESAAQAVASQTARQGSETAAAASVASAQTSSSKADEAGQKAAAAEVSRAAAETQRAQAEAARNTAVGAADTATGASASASSSATIAASVAGGRYINKKPGFTGAWSSGQIPTDWNDWASGWDNTRVAGLVTSDAVRFVVPAGADRGLQTRFAFGGFKYRPTANWWVGDFTVTLDAGSFEGSGGLIQVLNASGSAEVGTSLVIDFFAEFGAGVVGKTYNVSKLLNVTSPDAGDFSIYAMAGWSGFGRSIPAKTITFHFAGARPADAGEVETGKARGTYASVEARISAEELVRTTENAAMAVKQSLTEASLKTVINMVPNPTAALGLKNWNGGAGRLYADPLSQDGPRFLRTDTSPGDVGISSDPIPATGGYAYSLQAEVYTNYGAGQVRVYIAFRNAAGAALAYAVAWTGDANGDWSKIKVENFVSPAGTVDMVVVCDTYAKQFAPGSVVGWRKVKVENGTACTLFSDETTARLLASRVQSSEGALATVQGRQQAWIQKRVIAGQAEAFGEMVALDDNGNVTSAVNFGAKRIGLWNPVTGGWVEVASFSDGKARFSGDVAINGNLMIDGTINGRSALARDTVTPLAATYAGGILTLNGTVNTRLAEQVIATVGGPVVVNFNGLMIMQHEPAGSFDVTVEMRREKISGDGVGDLQIVSETVAGAGNTADDFIGKWPVMIIDRPGPGTWRYVMNARVSASNMTRKDVLNRFMSAMELRSNN